MNTSWRLDPFHKTDSFNEESAKRREAGLFKSTDIAVQIQKKKDKMDALLAEKGWQKCPECGGGMHPSFTMCKKCRTQKENEEHDKNLKNWRKTHPKKKRRR